ncbi:MAG: hemerythrin family protein [Thiobacillaceae bacterium]
MKRELRQQIIRQALPEIEAAHRTLFALCGQYYQELKTGGPDRDQVLNVFNEIMAQTRQHFDHEEKVLKKIIYPQHAAHQLAHRQILVDMVSLHEAMKAANEIMHKEAQHGLDALLIHHITEDATFPKLFGKSFANVR